MNTRKITDTEYISEFQPVGVWVLIEKDLLPEKTAGGIILSSKTRDTSIKWTGTGFIRAFCNDEWAVFEQPHDDYWRRCFRLGDHVGFSTQTPIVSPAPPQWQFSDSGETQSTKFVVITITDIIGIFLPTDEIRKEFRARFKSVQSKEPL